jgi:hypothetical protein
LPVKTICGLVSGTNQVSWSTALLSTTSSAVCRASTLSIKSLNVNLLG